MTNSSKTRESIQRSIREQLERGTTLSPEDQGVALAQLLALAWESKESSAAVSA